MTIWVDAQMSPAIAAWLSSNLPVNAVAVRDLGLRDATDTDKDGKYSLREVPYGDYTFRVSAGGFVTYEIRLYVASDTGTTLHVKLRK
jgi:hypothetical protein